MSNTKQGYPCRVIIKVGKDVRYISRVYTNKQEALKEGNAFKRKYELSGKLELEKVQS